MIPNQAEVADLDDPVEAPPSTDANLKQGNNYVNSLEEFKDMADLRDPLLDALGNAIKLEKTLDIADIYTLKSPALQEDFNQDAVGFLQSHK